MAGISPELTRGALVVGLLAGLAFVAYDALRTRAPSGDGPEPAAGAVSPGSQLAPALASGPDVDAEPEPPSTKPPTFDVVRVTPDGAAVIAGRAEPGARVTISSDAGTLAEATADAAGEFVAVFDAPPGDAPQALRLAAEDAVGVSTASSDVVVLLPPAPAAAPVSDGGAAALASADAPPDAKASAEVAVAPDGPGATAPTPETKAVGSQVAATVVLRGDGAEATPTAAGATAGGLSLASISYAESGLVTLAGIGSAGERLRAYVDDRFARDGAVGADGRWTLELGDVEAGLYRLRIDALRDDGTVVSRIETPFQRDFPQSAVPAAGTARPATITVQPGNNLWTLARIHYGSGVLYTQIHTANRDLIRDPELIYPGQIFVLPEDAPAE